MRGPVLLLAGLAFGQALAFEAASIHPSNPDAKEFGTSINGTSFTALDLTVRDLIAYAYEVHDRQVRGGTEWIEDEHFDIRARAATPISLEEGRRMLRQLLEKRFGLKVKRAMEEQRVHALVVGDRSKLKLRTEGQKPLGEYSPGRQIRGLYLAPLVAAFLERELDELVIDETGLTDPFELEVPLDGRSLQGILGQYGLKLETRRAPVETYTIENVLHPSEN